MYSLSIRRMIKVYYSPLVLHEKYLDEKCPLCGNILVVKGGKHGRFVGCSNYPACHFAKSLGSCSVVLSK